MNVLRVRAWDKTCNARVLHFELKANHRLKNAHQRLSVAFLAHIFRLKLIQKIITRLNRRNTLLARLFFERENRAITSAERNLRQIQDFWIELYDFLRAKPRRIDNKNKKSLTLDFLGKPLAFRAHRVLARIKDNRKIFFVRKQRAHTLIL